MIFEKHCSCVRLNIVFVDWIEMFAIFSIIAANNVNFLIVWSVPKWVYIGHFIPFRLDLEPSCFIKVKTKYLITNLIVVCDSAKQVDLSTECSHPVFSSRSRRTVCILHHHFFPLIVLVFGIEIHLVEIFQNTIEDLHSSIYIQTNLMWSLLCSDGTSSRVTPNQYVLARHLILRPLCANILELRSV